MVNTQRVCSETEGIEVPTNVETNALTVFANEACDASVVRGANYARPTSEYSDPSISDIKAYLQRPALMASITYDETTRKDIIKQSITTANLQTAFDNFNRLSGCYGFRCTLCFRLQIAATPFQAGLLRMYWLPCNQAANIYAEYDPAPANLISQLPGVYLDITEKTAVEFRVPWVHALDYLPYNTNGADFPDSIGTLGIYAYTPVVVGSGQPVPTGSVWWWLEDVEVVGAVPDNCMLVTPQMAAPSDAEERSTGPIERALNTGARVATIFSGIPTVSAFAGSTAWALRIGAQVASAFGWSKPRVTSAVNRVFLTDNTYINNCDGHDTAYSLGLFADNKVSALPGFAGSDVDEMAIAFILSQWALCANFSMATTASFGSVIYGCNISPSALWYQGAYNYAKLPGQTTDASPKAFLTTPAFYMGQCFTLWRGSFTFRFRVAKTKFHTGRILIGFTPVFRANSTVSGTQFLTPKITSSPLSYTSAQWDLRVGNTFDFTVPFLTPMAYVGFLDSIGDLTIQVIEPLGAPANVGQSIPFCVEVCCGPAFEFACPRTPTFPAAPINVSAAQVYVAQMGAGYKANTESGMEHCIGERVLSIKQLISRGTLWNAQTDSSNVGGLWGADAPANFTLPTTRPSYNVVPAPTATGSNADMFSFASYFSVMYLFWRGGQRISVVTNNGCLSTATITLPTVTGATPYNGSTSSGTIIEGRSTLCVYIPYYSPLSRQFVTPAGLNVYNRGQNIASILVRARTTAASLSFAAYAAAGDDAQLGYFLGSPPLQCLAPALLSRPGILYGTIATRPQA